MVLLKNKGVCQMPGFHFPSKEERLKLISMDELMNSYYEP